MSPPPHEGTLAPYRGVSLATPIEQLVRRRFTPVEALPEFKPGHLYGSVLAVAAVAALLANLGVVAPLTGLVAVVTSFALAGLILLRHPRLLALRAARQALADVSLPVEGCLPAWLAAPLSIAGSVEVELLGHHPLVEPAVRVAAPRATLEWPEEHVLRVTPVWQGEETDIVTLARLLKVVLETHRHELGVVRVRCVRPPPPDEPPALDLPAQTDRT